jgi:hypothetical protein
MRRSGKSKPVVWTWQARFMAEGVEGLFGERKSLLILVPFEGIARAPFTRRRNMIAEP